MKPSELPTGDLLVLSGDSVSASQVADLARRVAAATKTHPRFSPTRAGPREPLRKLKGGFGEFIDEELSRASGRPFRILFGDPERALYATLDVFPDNRLDRAPRTHVIDASIPLAHLDSDAREEFAAWAVDLFDALDVFHGYVTTADMQAQRKALISDAAERGDMPLPLWDDPLYTTFDRMVSDVYWVNYFGRAFVSRWGLDRLLSVSKRHEVRPTGAVAVWAADAPPTPDPNARLLTDYAFKRPFYEALGLEAFTHEGPERQQPGIFVPTLQEHRASSAALPGAERR